MCRGETRYFSVNIKLYPDIYEPHDVQRCIPCLFHSVPCGEMVPSVSHSEPSFSEPLGCVGSLAPFHIPLPCQDQSVSALFFSIRPPLPLHLPYHTSINVAPFVYYIALCQFLYDDAGLMWSLLKVNKLA